MKKFFYGSLVLISMLFVACSEDYTDPKALSGTTWRCSDFSGNTLYTSTFDYLEFRFVSTSTVEGWNKLKGGAVEKNGSATYSIKGNILTIETGGGSQTVTIDKKTMTMSDEGVTLVFKKQ